MTKATDIWLGDLLRAFAALRPGDDATRAQVAGMCGFAWTPREEASSKPQAPRPGPVAAAAPVAREATLLAAASARPPTAVDAATEPPQLLPWTSATDSHRALEWDAVPGLEPYSSDDEAPPPHLSLFRPEWSRMLAASLSASRLPIGPVDGARLVDTVARGLPVRRIERLSKWSIVLGLQLLVDVATGMEPFIADAIDFRARLKECVGPDHVHDFDFADAPMRGVFVDGEIVPYRWPDPGVPVLVITDLGLGGSPSHLGRSRVPEWLEFAQALRARGSPLRLLVPQSSQRWPAGLREHLAMIEWDRPTTVGEVLRMLHRSR